MNDIVEKALVHWGLSGAQYDLIAARENAVYKITTADKPLALRVHRQGYRTDQELWSELEWMRALELGGLHVPGPIKSTSGKVLHHIEGAQVDVLSWLSGDPLSEVFAAFDPAKRAKVFYALGHNMAQLHHINDAWTPPPKFERCSWDCEGLLGETPLWGRFWENPELSTPERELLERLRDQARRALGQTKIKRDYGLIHGDLVSANVMLHDASVKMIDFDDGGFGYRAFEIATSLLKFHTDPDYNALKAALIDGYRSTREIDLQELDLFMALRAASYVGWNIARVSEHGAFERNTRFINTACHFARLYLTP